MVDYRIYWLTSRGGIAGVGTEAKCASDQEVRELAQRMLDTGGQAEVWAGTRCVGRVSTASIADIEALGRFSAPDRGAAALL